MDIKDASETTKRQNDSAFWKMLSEVLNETTMEEQASDRDQLFHPIPGSDVTSGDKDEQSELQEVKLKLMLGISFMTLFLFLILLTICGVTLYKLNKLSSKNVCETPYPVNPELAALSYFHPTEGVSDTSFSKSAESSTFWGNAPSEFRRPGIRKSKSRNMADMISTASEDTCVNDESDLPHSEYPEFLSQFGVAFEQRSMLPSAGYLCNFPCPLNSQQAGDCCQRLYCHFRHREMLWERNEAGRCSCLAALWVQKNQVEYTGEKGLAGGLLGGLGEELTTKQLHIFSPPVLGRYQGFS
ncbi:equatorin [Choloepus didactylus]|uniref:equatorin n=1 Tax=Choloepus didactylus TaxID=27675 RepID=UPI00189E81A4|nr:equatorin [Choloepus didactylus]